MSFTIPMAVGPFKAMTRTAVSSPVTAAVSAASAVLLSCSEASGAAGTVSEADSAACEDSGTAEGSVWFVLLPHPASMETDRVRAASTDKNFFIIVFSFC